jgi:hypothetical protein
MINRKDKKLQSHGDTHDAGIQFLRPITRATVILLTGVISSLVCLVLWMMISLRFHVTWIPVITALFTALTIRIVAKSENPLVGVFCAILSLVTALTGNCFSIMVLISKFGSKPLDEIALGMNFPIVVKMLVTYTRLVDILMYAGVLYAGFWFSILHKSPSSTV